MPFERYPWLLFALLACIYLPAALAGSHAKPLWHDELFTYYIAQSPTLHELWSDLRTHDLNPPLVYLLTRWSFRVFGVNTLATRLPEILFFLVALAGIFRFVLRRMGALFAGFAVALMFLGKTFDLAFEARPYTLLLGFLALALTGWQDATETRRRRTGIALLAFACLGMLLSHIFSVPAIGALIAAELWRSRRRRKLDLPVLAALLLPFLVVGIYAPMLQNHGHAIYPPDFQPTGETIFDFYISAIERELIALLLAGLLVLLTLGPAHLRSGPLQDRPRWAFPQHEWVAIIGLLSLPLLLMLELMLTHGAFFPRYGAAATIGVVILVAALFCRWTSDQGRPDGRAALLGIVIALLISDHTFTGLGALFTGQSFRSPAHSDPVLPPCDSCRQTEAAGPDGRPLPLVEASGLTFIEMSHNEPPATVDRLYYLTDAQASTEIAHANIFERMPALVDRFHLHGHVVNYHDFLRAHPHFYVLGKYDWPEDWLLKKLVDDHATVRVMGRTADEYRDEELYEVTATNP